MTTRKEKFEADRKKMLAQTGNEDEIEARVEVEIEVEVEEVEQTDSNFHGIDISQIPNKADKDGMRNRIQKIHDDFNQDSFDLFDEDGDRDAFYARKKAKEEKEEKEKRDNNNLRGFYNFVCWFFFLVSSAAGLYNASYMVSIQRWQYVDTTLEYLFVTLFILGISAMVWAFFHCLSQVLLSFLMVLNIEIYYFRWLFNGMNPKSF